LRPAAIGPVRFSSTLITTMTLSKSCAALSPYGQTMHKPLVSGFVLMAKDHPEEAIPVLEKAFCVLPTGVQPSSVRW